MIGALAMLASFTLPGAWWAAIIAVGVLSATTWHATARFSTAMGAVAGALFFGGLLHWMTVVGWDAWLGLTLLNAAWWAVMFPVIGLVQRFAAWPLLVPAVWVLQETLRSLVPLGGFPWGLLAYSQPDGPFASVAAFAGSSAVAYAVALLGGLLAFAGKQAWIRHWRQFAATAAAITAIVVSLLGSALLVDPWSSRAGVLRVAVVQGGTAGTGLSVTDERRAVLANHVRQTLTLADRLRSSGDSVDLVVWPESSTDIDPFRDREARADIAAAVASVGAPTLVGAVTRSAADATMAANTGILWDPVTGPGQTYVKRHPVPFGEYVPFRSVLGPLASRFALVPRDFEAGTTPGLFTVAGTPVGEVICFEIAFDGLVRDLVDVGAQVLVVQTNNATYSGTRQPEQQLAISRLRAIEYGRFVVIAATSGISAVIAPDGSVQQSVGDAAAGVMIADVEALTGRSPGSRWGAWIQGVLAALGTASIAAALLARRYSVST